MTTTITNNQEQYLKKVQYLHDQLEQKLLDLRKELSRINIEVHEAVDNAKRKKVLHHINTKI